MRIYIAIVFIIFSCATFGQSPTIEGHYCDAPEWGMPVGQDFSDDTPTATSDVENLWMSQSGDTVFVAWSRFALGSGTSSFNLLFDGDCDGEGDDLLIELVWGAIGTDQNEPIEINVSYDSGSYTITNGWQGQRICGDSATAGKYAEYYFLLSDLIAAGVYDPCDCACGELTLDVAGSFAGGSFNSALKDPFDISYTPPTYTGSSGLINCPGELMISTMDNATIDNWLNSFTAVAGCGAFTLSNSYSPTGFTDLCGQMNQIVTFTAIDPCGNVSTCMANLVIGAVAGPAMNCPPDITLDCGITTFDTDVTSWLGSVTAMDVDGSLLAVTNNYSSTGFMHTCGLAGMQTVTFTSMNSCGLMSNCTARLFKEDNEGPIMTCPTVTNASFECSNPNSDADISNLLNSASAFDACSMPMVINVTNNYDPNNFMGGCGGVGSQIVTLSAVDFCGNISTCQLTLEIIDSTPPVLTCPNSTLDLECNDPINEVSIDNLINSVTIIDDCSSELPAVSNNYSPINYTGGCSANTGSQVITFSATDLCGTLQSCQVTITITDTNSPVVSCPSANLILECGDPNNSTTITNWLNSASASDACSSGGPSITNNYNPNNFITTCGNAGTQLVDFTATDDCNLISMCQVTIVIQDTQVPVINCPSDLILEVGQANIQDLIDIWLMSSTANDLCQDGALIVSNDFSDDNFMEICGAGKEQFVRFNTQDQCGNINSCTASITISDTTPPEINCPQNITIECSEPFIDIKIQEFIDEVIASDNSGSFLITNDYTINSFSVLCGTTGDADITFTVVDECGLSNSCTANVSIIDITAPIIHCNDVEPIVLECGSPSFTQDLNNWLNSFIADDDCSSNVNMTNDYNELGFIGECSNTGIQIVTFIATDDCGNSSSCQSTITLEDITPPEIICSEQDTIVIDCGDTNGHQLFQDFVNQVVATDQCDNDVDITTIMLYANPLQTPCGSPVLQIWRVYATDDCGNQSTCDFVVKVFENKLGNLVWHDLNANGVQDPGEPGYPEVPVYLYDSNGNFISSQLTDVNGYYNFSYLLPNDYYVSILPPDEFKASEDFIGTDNEMDSDFVDNTSQIHTIEARTINLTVDGGIFTCVEIGQTVWLDFNGNQVEDYFENGLNNVPVLLYRKVEDDFQLEETHYTGHQPGTISNDGYWKTCVDPGEFYIKYNVTNDLKPVQPNVGSSDLTDSEVTNANGPNTTDTFEGLSDQDLCSMNAGYNYVGSVGDLVWLDSNGNGMRESNEPGMADVLVTARDVDNQVLNSAVSDENGNYLISDLSNSTFFLHFDVPSGYAVTQAHVGNNETMDSDVTHENGYMTTGIVHLEDVERVRNMDAGLMYGTLDLLEVELSGNNVGTFNELNWYLDTDNLLKVRLERAINSVEEFTSIFEYDPNIEKKDQFSDESKLEGIYYYRLQYVTQHGEIEYSKIISINVTKQNLNIQVYPNPADDILYLKINNISISSVHLELRNITGQLVYQERHDSDNSELMIDISTLNTGVYILRVIQNHLDDHILIKIE